MTDKGIECCLFVPDAFSNQEDDGRDAIDYHAKNHISAKQVDDSIKIQKVIGYRVLKCKKITKGDKLDMSFVRRVYGISGGSKGCLRPRQGLRKQELWENN